MSRDLLKLPDKEEEVEELQCTPMAASKSPICSALDCIVSVIDNHKDRVIADDKSNASSSNTKTPPIQASFSPEIQSSTTMTTSSACYAAGHLISGVTDKRKCRARGILAVALPADNDMPTYNSNSVDPKQGYATGLVSKSSVSRLPSPAKASVHWLDLSPCREADEDDKEFSVPLNSLLQAKEMSVSWRDGLVSQIFEKDEFDRCRCLSDEEEDFNVNSSDPCKSSQSLEINVDEGNVPTVANACEPSEFLDGKSNDKRHSPVQCSYTESICTDGPGGLTHSADSDWNLFYKNNQFEV
ncbi:hypothetical protein CCACVL1_24285 [Corchorus capsularis]|uniref:Uncharacterized protein n=1 Tax=Corchorus capsularis TaxID=210143 RepID=A0A1R3GQ79_COCAP|nr:hypothetical protein CCACVL1_24285 [Corchorus capsularis]